MANGWIKIRHADPKKEFYESVPDNDRDVLVQLKKGFVRVGYRICDRRIPKWYAFHHDESVFVCDDSHVQAWMEMPSKYKDEEEIPPCGGDRESDTLIDTVKNEISFRASQSGLRVEYSESDLFQGKTRCTFFLEDNLHKIIAVCYGQQPCNTWLAGYEDKNRVIKDRWARTLIEKLEMRVDMLEGAAVRIGDIERKLKYHELRGGMEGGRGG